MRDASDPLRGGETARPSTVGILHAVGAAVVLSLLSVVPVASSFLLRPPDRALRNSGWVQGPIDWQPMEPSAAVALACAVVVSSAVVGGLAGGLVWRWRRFAGAAVALTSAWAGGVMTLPVAAAALGVHLRTGIVCVMGCETLLRDDRPFAGPVAYLEFLAGTIFVLWSVVLPALIVLVVVRVLFAWVRGRAAARPRLPLIPSVLAFAAGHGIALVWTASAGGGGFVPYLSLTIGVVAWATWMDRGGLRLLR